MKWGHICASVNRSVAFVKMKHINNNNKKNGEWKTDNREWQDTYRRLLSSMYVCLSYKYVFALVPIKQEYSSNKATIDNL